MCAGNEDRISLIEARVRKLEDIGEAEAQIKEVECVTVDDYKKEITRLRASMSRRKYKHTHQLNAFKDTIYELRSVVSPMEVQQAEALMMDRESARRRIKGLEEKLGYEHP